MARRNKNIKYDVAYDDYDDYGDYGDYGPEVKETSEQQAIRLSKETFKEE